jgi:nucleotide-binding universal stress UspA family protein
METQRRRSSWSGGHGRIAAQEEVQPADRVAGRRRTIERIVVPLDGSTTAECALPHALAIARAFDAKVVLLSVIESQPNRYGTTDSAEWRLERASARAYLEGLVTRFADLGVELEWELAEGRASEQILRVAETRNADLIAVCSHGRGGITEFNLSGTASKVLRGAGCSVFVARARENATADASVSYNRVLAAVDCTKRSQWAVHLAGSIARAHGAELVLGTVIARPAVLGDAEARARAEPLAAQLVRLNRDVARDHLNQLVATIADPDLVVLDRIVEGDHVGRSLAQLAEDERCSLMVLSAHGGVPDTDWPFGSAPSLLLEHATMPVLVLQDVAWKDQRRGTAGSEGVSRLPAQWT